MKASEKVRLNSEYFMCHIRLNHILSKVFYHIWRHWLCKVDYDIIIQAVLGVSNNLFNVFLSGLNHIDHWNVLDSLSLSLNIHMQSNIALSHHSYFHYWCNHVLRRRIKHQYFKRQQRFRHELTIAYFHFVILVI